MLIGDAPADLVIASGHCHYGSVAALFILARHDPGNAAHSTMALKMLGGAALDFLEDSAWPLSSLVPQLHRTQHTVEMFTKALLDLRGFRGKSLDIVGWKWLREID